MHYALAKGITIAATIQLIGVGILLYSCQSEAGQFSVVAGVAPIFGEEKVFTETLMTTTYRMDALPVQFYVTKTQITNIYGAEAIYPFPEWGIKGLELFLGFAYQSEHQKNDIVGSPIMYSFGFQAPTLVKDVRFMFRHGSSGNYFRGPLCGANDRCDSADNSGWNSLNLEYMWMF
mgnify:FL=1